MKKEFPIGSRQCGSSHPAFITAEIGLNHNGDVETALKLIDAAAESGVDAVKFQVFKADSFVSGDIEKAAHQKKTLEEEETLWEMWKRLEFSKDDLVRLMERAAHHDLCFYASPFDEESVDLLVAMGAPVMKVASGEVTNLPLIRKMAETGLPLIMSVGMASLGEIEAAIEAASHGGCDQLALLHCVANYPAELKDTNLARMAELERTFGVPVGFSDHTVGHFASITAAALGATFIEKHFTLDRDLPGTDHTLSADLAMMQEIIAGVRAAEEAIGSPSLSLLDCESEGRTLFRRGLVTTTAIPAGTVVEAAMLGAKRPATGITPGLRDVVIGRQAKQDIPAGAPVTWEDI